jgi:hypothetical protein
MALVAGYATAGLPGRLGRAAVDVWLARLARGNTEGPVLFLEPGYVSAAPSRPIAPILVTWIALAGIAIAVVGAVLKTRATPSAGVD